MKTTVKSKIVAYVVSAILIVFCLFPIYWMLITSLKTSTEIYKIVPTFWPKKLTFEGYYELFAEKGFMKNVLNSLFVSLIVSFGSIAISMPAAYAIAKNQIQRKKTGIKRNPYFLLDAENSSFYTVISFGNKNRTEQ